MKGKQLQRYYDPNNAEKRIYQQWEKAGFFTPTAEGKTFSIPMPPPNITGNLHMGHALDNTLQDILSRWKRMEGFSVLWLPGTDHASIATETKVVKALEKEGKTKYDIGREAFLERLWQWKAEYGGTITEQLRRLGCSCDWTRERFTMDEGLNKAVNEVFIQLYHKGLIYRGDYIINWCTQCRTTLSDIEVEHIDKDGNLYHIKYPLVDEDDYLIIATTRPETILGDTAVAVNPADQRYQSYIGKKIKLPLMAREIPIIADEYVDQEFGTGALKITPGHDHNDFEIGVKHNLPAVHVIDEEGYMTKDAGKYHSLNLYDCRKQVINDLKAQGLLVKIEDYQHGVGHCYRCQSVVEPLVSKQWFVKMKPLAQPAIKAAENGDVRFVPERFTKIYLHWLEEIRDWCISRQLWWGHRIPVWYCNCGKEIVQANPPQKCGECGNTQLKQDEDVLDTWFSSALWPFSTLGWPEQTQDLKRFFPADVLITGRDIIFFWVARMIFSSLEFMGEVPFQDVLIHGLLRDADGRKMSKSLGTGIDPLEIIDQSGADALRFALISGMTMGNDARFRDEKVEAARNFTNKLWNAARFYQMNMEEGNVEELTSPPENLASAWILSRLNNVIEEMNEHLTKYRFNEAAQTIYDFIWTEFCDWYLEMIKAPLNSDSLSEQKQTRSVLDYVFREILKLLHPLMPFVTEEIFQHIQGDNTSIMIAKWPEFKSSFNNQAAEEKMAIIQSLIRGIRNIRQEMEIKPHKKIKVIFSTDATQQEFIAANKDYFYKLAAVDSIEFKSTLAETKGAVSLVIRGIQIDLPLAQMMDLDKEYNRLQKEYHRIQSEIDRVEKMLANQGFVQKAPAHLVTKEKEKQQEYLKSLQQLEQRISQIKKAAQNG